MHVPRFASLGTWAVVGLILAGALALRLPALDAKPMHGDEANQAVRTGILLEQGRYHYDPTDHHGPVLYFAALPFCRATSRTFAGTTEWNYRLVPVCFSLLTLLLTLGLGMEGRGRLFDNRSGLFAALLFTAISPAMVYYSRFYIQESLLITFLTGMLVSAAAWARVRRLGEVDAGNGSAGRRRALLPALAFGCFAGLAIATKETVVISFASMAVAVVFAFGWKPVLRSVRWGEVLLAALTALVVATLFFSSFFSYPQGVYDAFVSSFSAYFSRATRIVEHQHPWTFYLKILFWFKYGRGPLWSEAGLLVPAAVACAVAGLPVRLTGRLISQPRLVRFLSIYTLVLTALYSLIPYKTPWCSLSFLHGYILLAGVGVGVCVAGISRCRRITRWIVLLTVAGYVGLTAFLHVRQAYRACFKLPADPRNPYVYAHTGADALNLIALVETAAKHQQGYETPIAVIAPTPDTWPLPWYLRAYTQVGYWNRVDEVPTGFKPTIVITSADQGDTADLRFGKGKQASFFGIRPGVLLNAFVPEKLTSH